MKMVSAAVVGAIFVTGAVTYGVMAAGVDKLQDGYELTESFSSDLGGDAEAFYRTIRYSQQGFGIAYSSTLGTVVQRQVRADDRAKSNTYMLGFAEGMPQTLPGVTSLGISADTLVALRENGQAPLTLMHNGAQDTIDGTLRLVGKGEVRVIIGNQVAKLNGIHAHGVFRKGAMAGEGVFVFLNNRRNPLTLSYAIKFSWEQKPRLLKITRIVAGPTQRSAMEQALAMIGKLELYGIHFNFGKATIQPDTNSLIASISTTLKNNPGWTLSVEGHTDSIGGEAVNQALSQRRAEAVVSALVNRHGINRNRLKAVGHGMSQPKATNEMLEGRALNRRVELVRTDK